ncbi:DUF167 domain-containing protein [Salinispora cortesiana]|uniref:DUF167 domain-containing protein n=1 Tax=Salinispora cortesiana TaxID=1305843 RepID=UPI000472287E|nr:DUF167 domain-containing protein [Salinispora cortesiana]
MPVPEAPDAHGDEPLTVAVRIKPGSSRSRVGGRYPGPYGPALVIAVTAPPVDGRATEAALRVLAEALGVRRRAVSLGAGAASRDKIFYVGGVSAEIAQTLHQLRDG